MDKNELKNLLRPLIKETIKEVLISEGLISTIIAETMKGVMTSGVVIKEQQASSVPFPQFGKKQTQQNEEELELERRVNEKMKLAEQKKEERVKKLFKNFPKAFDGIAPLQEDDIPPPGQQTSQKPERLVEEKRSKAIDEADKKAAVLERKAVNPAIEGMLNQRGVDLTNIMALAGGSNVWRNQLGK